MSTRRDPIDSYREWSYQERCDAWDDPESRENVEKYNRDSESSDRAYDNWRAGLDFSDPDPEGRFH